MAKMKICGLQKTTLLDYPGKVAATVFLGGCNFRCPFCHNSDLLTGSAPERMTPEELLTFLKRRQGILEGVCITGGEPTLWPEDAAELMRRIKEMDYQVKLDTNGYRPQVLKDLCGLGVVDYVAMDIKAGRQHYAEVCGHSPIPAPAELTGDAVRHTGQPEEGMTEPAEPTAAGMTVHAKLPAAGAAVHVKLPAAGAEAHTELTANGTTVHAKLPATGAAPHAESPAAGTFRLAAIEESAAWLMEGHVPYEFRTTTVKGIHTAEDFTDIAAWIGGCERYFIQGFVDSGNVLKSGFSAYTRAELDEFLNIVRKTIPNAEIRGVDY